MPASDSRRPPVILVACNNAPLTDRISSVLDGSFSLELTTSSSGLDNRIKQSNPLLTMLDPALFGDSTAGNHH